MEEEIRFLSSKRTGETKTLLLGCPLEETVTFRQGTRLGPPAIREASEGLESFSPALNRDLEAVSFGDLGDLTFRRGDLDSSLSVIRQRAHHLFSSGRRVLALGGEHLITLPLLEAAISVYPHLRLLQLDAHADLREEYQGQRLSHATVIKRILGLSKDVMVYQCGVRSGTQEEMNLARHSNQIQVLQRHGICNNIFQNHPFYLTLDLDVLDPGVLPGTGTPEPGGWSFRALEESLHALRGCQVVGADVVELAPGLDPSGVSATVAAKVVRELLLVISE